MSYYFNAGTNPFRPIEITSDPQEENSDEKKEEENSDEKKEKEVEFEPVKRNEFYIPGLGAPPVVLPREGGELYFAGPSGWGYRCIVKDSPNQQVSSFGHAVALRRTSGSIVACY